MQRINLVLAVTMCTVVSGIAAYAVAQRPQPDAPSPFGHTITSDDGQVTATLINTGGAYALSGDVSYRRSGIFVSAKGNVVLELAGHTLTFGTDDTGGCSGIAPLEALSRSPRHGHDDRSFSQSLANLDYGKRTLTIKGPGTIRWGGTRGRFAAAIGGHYTFPVVLENVTLDVGGPDAACVSVGHLTMRDCVCINRSDSTANRHQAPANIRVDHKCIADRNVLIGGNSGFAVGHGSRIRDNLIRNEAFATNGYGVFLYRADDVEITGNLILPANGRGVIVGGMPKDGGEPAGITVTDNVILALEQPNREFGENLQPCCLRSRYNVRRLRFERNTCLAIGGTGLTAAMAVYLTNRESGGTNRIAENDLMAVLLGETDAKANHIAAPLGLIGQGRMPRQRDEHEAVSLAEAIEPAAESVDEPQPYVADDVIEQNRLATNCVAFCLSHTDGGCNSAPVHVSQLEWLGGQEIYDRFTRAVDGWLAGHAFARAHLQEDYLPPGTNPTRRAVVYAGRYLGSKVELRVDDESGRSEETQDVLLYSHVYPLEVTLNGRTIEKPPAPEPSPEEAADRAVRAMSPQTHAELVRVIRAWPKLSPETRAEILRQVESEE